MITSRLGIGKQDPTTLKVTQCSPSAIQPGDFVDATIVLSIVTSGVRGNRHQISFDLERVVRLCPKRLVPRVQKVSSNSASTILSTNLSSAFPRNNQIRPRLLWLSRRWDTILNGTRCTQILVSVLPLPVPRSPTCSCGVAPVFMNMDQATRWMLIQVLDRCRQISNEWPSTMHTQPDMSTGTGSEL